MSGFSGGSSNAPSQISSQIARWIPWKIPRTRREEVDDQEMDSLLEKVHGLIQERLDGMPAARRNFSSDDSFVFAKFSTELAPRLCVESTQFVPSLVQETANKGP